MNEVARAPDLESFENEGDQGHDNSLRPLALEDFVGQAALRENLKVYIEAAKSRGDAMDHVLFFGPPGLGLSLIHI